MKCVNEGCTAEGTVLLNNTSFCIFHAKLTVAYWKEALWESYQRDVAAVDYLLDKALGVVKDEA